MNTQRLCTWLCLFGVFLVHAASTLSLGLQSGILLAVPIPDEHAAVGQEIEEAIQAAVTEARYRESMWLMCKSSGPLILAGKNVYFLFSFF